MIFELNPIFSALIIVGIIYLVIRLYDVIIKEKFSIDDTKPVGAYDGNKYLVQAGHSNYEVAADTFAKIDSSIKQFLTYLYEKYRFSENYRRREIATLLQQRYNTDALRESSPYNKDGDTSFTLNKGDIIAICIRSAENIHNFDIIMFVVLHELTHMSIAAYDHPEEFWEAFKFLLLEAEIGGFYTSPIYQLYPVSYCDQMVVNYNPRYDPAVSII